MNPITSITVNTCVGKDRYSERYRIQINRMESRGEYSTPMTFRELKKSYWIPEEEHELTLEFAYKNNAEEYDKTYDGICFDKKEDAEIVVDYLNTLYQTYLLRGKK